MGKPKKEIEKKEHEAFLKDLLTNSELRMVKKRWQIASFLDQGLNIRQTAVEAKASTSTVLRVKEKLKGGTGGLKLALERTREGRKKPKPEKAKSRPAAKWIFGKSE